MSSTGIWNSYESLGFFVFLGLSREIFSFRGVSILAFLVLLGLSRRICSFLAYGLWFFGTVSRNMLISDFGEVPESLFFWFFGDCLEKYTHFVTYEFWYFWFCWDCLEEYAHFWLMGFGFLGLSREMCSHEYILRHNPKKPKPPSCSEMASGIAPNLCCYFWECLEVYAYVLTSGFGILDFL